MDENPIRQFDNCKLIVTFNYCIILVKGTIVCLKKWLSQLPSSLYCGEIVVFKKHLRYGFLWLSDFVTVDSAKERVTLSGLWSIRIQMIYPTVFTYRTGNISWWTIHYSGISWCILLELIRVHMIIVISTMIAVLIGKFD